MNTCPKILPNPLGLYIHVPFCRRKCDYCAFASAHPRQGEIEAWLQGVAQELDRRLTPHHARRVTTIFIGGGNPTVIGASALSELIDLISHRLDADKIVEWTFESNPETLDQACEQVLLRVPRLRLSIGAQRLRDDELHGLGRDGSVDILYKALECAFRVTRRVGLDLILGVPGFPSLAPELEHLLGRFPMAHVSSYFLSAEPDTPLGKKVQDGVFPDPADVGPEELFEVADLLSRHDFEHYEISNFARSGERCLHNMLYWHNEEYLGIGPAAVSTMADERTTNPDTLSEWLANGLAGIPPDAEHLDETIKRHEFLMLRLRLIADGLDLEKYRLRFGNPPPQLLATLQRQRAEGVLKQDGEVWRLTRPGIAMANQVIHELF